MIAGQIVGVTKLADRIRFTVEPPPEDRHRGDSIVEVYPTGTALAAIVGDFLWTQSMRAYLTRPHSCYRDAELWMIRQDDGAAEPWPLHEAMHGRKCRRST